MDWRKSVEAVRAWRFKPGEKDGQPLNVRATVEISFRLMGVAFDEAAKQRRTRFNSIVTRMSKTADATPTPEHVTAMKELAKHRMPAAMFVLGIWQTKGLGMPQDVAAGLANVQKAADANYGPTLYFVGNAAMSGEGMPKDESKGLSLIRDAAVLGSPQPNSCWGASTNRAAAWKLTRSVPNDISGSARHPGRPNANIGWGGY